MSDVTVPATTPAPEAAGVIVRPRLAVGTWLRAGVLGLVIVVYVWLAASYAAATPPWNNPDEPAHFNYVAYVAQTGTLPEIQPGDWDQALLERLVASRFPPGENIQSIRYESWQPPLYYLLAAPVYLLAPAGDELAQVHALRYFDIALGALTLLLTFLLARDLFTRDFAPLGPRSSAPNPSTTRLGPWLALAVPVTLAGIPMFTAMSASIDNDALANLWGALLTLLLVRAAVARPSWRTTALLGGVLGLALLTKLTLGIFLPLALVALAWGGYRAGAPRDRMIRVGVLLLSVLLLVMLPWLLRQGLTYGWGDLFAKARHDAVVIGQPRTPGFTGEHVGYLLTTTFHSFWAQFGWMGIPVAEGLYWVWGALTLGAYSGLLVYAGRAVEHSGGALRYLDPRPWLLAATFGGMIGVVVYHNLTFIQAQGRFLYPALPGLCVLYVLGWSSLVPRTLRLATVILASVPLVALNAYVLTRFLVPAFAH